MIPKVEGWHYIVVKELSALLTGILSKHGVLFLTFLYSFRRKNKLASHKKACKNKDFCKFVMSSEDTKIL